MDKHYENTDALTFKKRMEVVFSKRRISGKNKTHQRFEKQKEMEEGIRDFIHNRHKT